MRARDRGESPAGRSGGVVDEACRCFGLGRGRYFAVLCLPQPAVPGHRWLHTARDRADADLFLRDTTTKEFPGAMPRVACLAGLAALRAAFLEQVSDPPHAVSPFLSLLPAERAAGDCNSRAHCGVCTGNARTFVELPIQRMRSRWRRWLEVVPIGSASARADKPLAG